MTVLLVEHHMGLVMSICRPCRGAQFRPQDRRGHAGPGAGRPRRDQGLSREQGPMTAMLERQAICAPITARSQVLHGLAFALDEGGITTLLGANGAGKTTTLRAICGMVRSHRRDRVRGQADHRPRRPRTSCGSASRMCRRAAAPSRTMTVEENLAARRDHAQRTRPASPPTSSACTAISRVLKERHTQQAGTLSGGEQQMLAVGRALMLRPRLMLLDEPSFGLAPLIVRGAVRASSRKINRDEKVTHAAGRAERRARARARRPGLSDRDRPHRDVGPAPRTSRTTKTSAAPIWDTEEPADGTLYSTRSWPASRPARSMPAWRSPW